MVSRIFWLVTLSCMLYGCSEERIGPKAEHFTTTQGAKGYWVYAPQLPMVDIIVAFDAGRIRDETHPGLAELTAQMLFEGSNGRSRDQAADLFAQLGAEIQVKSTLDSTQLHLRILADPKLLTPAVLALSDLLASPLFEDKAIVQQRQQLLHQHMLAQESAATLIDAAFMACVYPEHRYGQANQFLTAKTVTALDKTTVHSFYEHYYVARNAVISIVGQVHLEDAKRLAEVLMVGLQSGQKAPVIVKPASVESCGKEKHLPHPSLQTHLRWGTQLLHRQHPDYPALFLAHQMLGGNPLVSILGESVREARGLAYHVGTEMVPLQASTYFFVELQTQQMKTEKAKTAVEQTVRHFLAKGPTEAQLALAKAQIKGMVQRGFASNRGTASYFANLGVKGWSEKDLAKLMRRIDQLTPWAVHRTMQKYWYPKNWVWVSVGG